MRSILTSILEFCGLVSMTVGAGIWYWPAGLIVGGASAVAIGVALA